MVFNGRIKVTQPYTWNGKTGHGGIDIVGLESDKVRALAAGVVERVQFWDGKTKTGSQSYGNLVIVKGDDGLRYYYAHLKTILVKKGERVAKDQELGVMGSTGNSTGPHLHFEIRRGANRGTRMSPANSLGIPNERGEYKLSAPSSQPSAKKSNTEIAYEVIRGLWGNGLERKQRLTRAGYDYKAIQRIVNRLI